MPRLGRFREHRHTRFGDLAILAFFLAQAADGVLTYLGVRTFGLAVEGNPLVASLMYVLGQGPGVAAAKLVAASFGSALHLMTVHRIVAVLTGIYVVAAVTPWVYLLFFAGVHAFMP